MLDLTNLDSTGIYLGSTGLNIVQYSILRILASGSGFTRPAARGILVVSVQGRPKQFMLQGKCFDTRFPPNWPGPSIQKLLDFCGRTEDEMGISYRIHK